MKDELIVFVRIAVYAMAGRLAAGGWLPEDVARMVASPETVEAVVAVLLGAGALFWYYLSKARKALRGKA